LRSDLNIFSQAFAAIAACWKYFFGLVAAIFVLETVSLVYDLGTGLSIGRAFIEAATIFYLCATLLGLDVKSKETSRKYTGILIRYACLFYLPVFVIALVFIFSISAVAEDSVQARDFYLGVIMLAGMCVAFLSMYLFGTAFPAHLLGVSTGIGTAVNRSFRQAGYIIPRLLFGSGLIAALGFAILIFFENIGIGSDPITPAGTPNIPGGLVLLIAKLLVGYSFAVFSVVVCRAYLKDLEERGELPAAEADVFA